MLKILMGFALAAAFLLGLENHRSTQLQAWRTAEQGKLLAGLLALGRPAVSQLVADWSLLYPEPNDDRLQELRDIARQLHADPPSLVASDGPARSATAGAAGAAGAVQAAP